MSDLFAKVSQAMNALRNSKCLKCGKDLGRKCDPTSEEDIPICGVCFLGTVETQPDGSKITIAEIIRA